MSDHAQAPSGRASAGRRQRQAAPRGFKHAVGVPIQDPGQDLSVTGSIHGIAPHRRFQR